MNKTFKTYRNIIGLLLVTLLAVALCQIHLFPAPVAFALVCCWQLLQFARSKAYRRGECFTSVLTPEQINEFERILDGVKGYDGMFKELAEVARTEGGIKKLFTGLLKQNDDMRMQLRSMRRGSINGMGTGVRWIGNKPFVTDDCAAALTSVFVLECARLKGGLEALVADSAARERIIGCAAGNLGLATRAALDGTTTPLPTVYVPQVIELVWKYGQARQYATVYPLGAGTVKLPRLKAGEDDFGYFGAGTAGMSQAITEKRVTAELVTFTANKGGGLIRFPTEIEEDTFIPLGQFLARYIGRQLAKLEDKTMFLGDGSATYASQTGVGPYCVANNTYLQQLAAGKTKPTDATINDFRAMRGLINAAALVDDAAYYMNPTLADGLLPNFNTIGQPLIYKPATGNQPATLDGYPIRWVAVLQPFSTKAAASSFLAMFGALSYWYLGERGAPRIEVSREVFFATDELAMRALERIDVEAMAIDAMSALQTAAA